MQLNQTFRHHYVHNQQINIKTLQSLLQSMQNNSCAHCNMQCHGWYVLKLMYLITQHDALHDIEITHVL